MIIPPREGKSCSMSASLKEVKTRFTQLFSADPVIVRAPGRINLIGEHTDYNGGFVMPAAINYDTVFAIGDAGDGVSEVFSVKYNESFVFDIENPQPVSSPAWANYLLGVLKQVKMKGLEVKPFKCSFGGDVPLGAGLSSSASVECGFAFALNEFNNLGLSKETMVHMAQWAEHNFAGVKCGIMDQFASMMGKKGHVIVLDCRSLEYRYSPLDLPNHDVVLCDTRVKHSLVDSEYNTRRQECEEAVAVLRKHFSKVASLRDVSEEMLQAHKNDLPGKVFDRALYVVQEIKRVQEASEDLKANRLEDFGKKMYETHEGLSKLYQVSCPELDFLVEQAHKHSVVGARMMGGGFGGCTINIVEKNKTTAFINSVADAYQKQFDLEMHTYVVSIEDGTGLIGDR